MNTANDIFKQVYGHSKNFMTPTIRYRKVVGDYAVELSAGRGFRNESIFGVTVLTLDGEKRPALSKIFYSESEAETYINNLSKA